MNNRDKIDHDLIKDMLWLVESTNYLGLNIKELVESHYGKPFYEVTIDEHIEFNGYFYEIIEAKLVTTDENIKLTDLGKKYLNVIQDEGDLNSVKNDYPQWMFWRQSVASISRYAIK